MSNVTLGTTPKWFLVDGKLVDNPDYVEPELSEPEDIEHEDEVGTVSVNIFTNSRQILTEDGWKELLEGDVVIKYKSTAPRWFDCVGSKEVGTNISLQHCLFDTPKVIFGKSRTEPLPYRIWSSDVECIKQFNGNERFKPLKVHSVTDSEIVLDTEGLGENYVLYLFSESGANKALDSIG